MNTNNLIKLMQQVAKEKKRLAAEVRLAASAGTFDCSAADAEFLLQLAHDQLYYDTWHKDEARQEAEYGWDGLWTNRDANELSKMEADLKLIANLLNQVRAKNDALIPF